MPPSKCPPGLEVLASSPPQRSRSSLRSTPKPRQRIPAQSSGKRKGFYNDIDPDLFALTGANERNGSKKKPKRGLLAKDTPPTPRGAGGRVIENDIASGPIEKDKRLPVPIPTRTQGPSEFPTSSAQVQSRKTRGFAVDPDLLAAASPVKAKEKLQRSTGWRAPVSEVSPTVSFQATQRAFRHKQILSDDIVPETSPPPSSPPPTHIMPLPDNDAQISIIDLIEDYVSPRKSKHHHLKTEGLDILHSDIDITSSPPLSCYHPSVPDHTDDLSDSVPDPDFMTPDDPGTPLPMHKRLLKELKQQTPATPASQTPRLGYLNIHDLQKSVVVPKADPPRPSHPQYRYFSPGGLADTLTGWRGELHGTSIFKQRVQPRGIEYIITVFEAVQDGDIILIKGNGEEGVVKVIISGSARTRSQISVGQVVKYGRPWVVVNLLGKGLWKCLMGNIEVQEMDGDINMGE